MWKAVFNRATIGESRLAGAFTFDRGRTVPLLSGRLTGSRLLLKDLGPAVGADAAVRPRPRSAPRRPPAAAKGSGACCPIAASTCRRCARWKRTC